MKTIFWQVTTIQLTYEDIKTWFFTIIKGFKGLMNICQILFFFNLKTCNLISLAQFHWQLCNFVVEQSIFLLTINFKLIFFIFQIIQFQGTFVQEYNPAFFCFIIAFTKLKWQVNTIFIVGFSFVIVGKLILVIQVLSLFF